MFEAYAEIEDKVAYCPLCGEELCRIIDGQGAISITCECGEEVIVDLWQD